MENKTITQKNIKIDRDNALKHLHDLYLIRKFEEKSAEMYTKTEIRGFLHLYIGEEAVAVGTMSVLKPEDYVLSTYREHGHALARGIDAGAIMAEMFGKKEGCSGGRGGSMHLFDKKKNFFGGNAIVAGHLPVAVGMALASKKLKKNNITCCIFGEGAAAEGEFHEAMNLASLWQVPVLFVCENNLYAMGTALKYTHAMTQLEKKGEAYGIDSIAVDGMDLLAVQSAVEKAVQSIQQNGMPFFLVCNTYRFRAHSMFDAELYRDKSEVEEWKKKDPIVQFQNLLLTNNIITDKDVEEINIQVESQIKNAVEFAEAGIRESSDQLNKFVYSGNKK